MKIRILTKQELAQEPREMVLNGTSGLGEIVGTMERCVMDWRAARERRPIILGIVLGFSVFVGAMPLPGKAQAAKEGGRVLQQEVHQQEDQLMSKLAEAVKNIGVGAESAIAKEAKRDIDKLAISTPRDDREQSSSTERVSSGGFPEGGDPLVQIEEELQQLPD